MMKINTKALALAFGIIWGAAICLMGITSMTINWGTELVALFSGLYIGYCSTPLGTLIGTVWGFVDGAIFGLLLGWLYNKFSCCRCKDNKETA